jgi:hypothetical protein
LRQWRQKQSYLGLCLYLVVLAQFWGWGCGVFMGDASNPLCVGPRCLVGWSNALSLLLECLTHSPTVQVQFGREVSVGIDDKAQLQYEQCMEQHSQSPPLQQDGPLLLDKSMLAGQAHAGGQTTAASAAELTAAAGQTPAAGQTSAAGRTSTAGRTTAGGRTAAAGGRTTAADEPTLADGLTDSVGPRQGQVMSLREVARPLAAFEV